MKKLDKISQIKFEFYKNFQKLDQITNSTSLGEELNILIKIYNIKEYLKRKVKEIETTIEKI